MKLDEWIETSFHGEDVTHIMYTVFIEDIEYTNMENRLATATPRIKVKFKDGTESGWYKEPLTRDVLVKGKYVFGG